MNEIKRSIFNDRLFLMQGNFLRDIVDLEIIKNESKSVETIHECYFTSILGLCSIENEKVLFYIKENVKVCETFLDSNKEFETSLKVKKLECVYKIKSVGFSARRNCSANIKNIAKSICGFFEMNNFYVLFGYNDQAEFIWNKNMMELLEKSFASKANNDVCSILNEEHLKSYRKNDRKEDVNKGTNNISSEHKNTKYKGDLDKYNDNILKNTKSKEDLSNYNDNEYKNTKSIGYENKYNDNEHKNTKSKEDGDKCNDNEHKNTKSKEDGDKYLDNDHKNPKSKEDEDKYIDNDHKNPKSKEDGDKYLNNRRKNPKSKEDEDKYIDNDHKNPKSEDDLDTYNDNEHRNADSEVDVEKGINCSSNEEKNTKKKEYEDRKSFRDGHKGVDCESKVVDYKLDHFYSAKNQVLSPHESDCIGANRSKVSKFLNAFESENVVVDINSRFGDCIANKEAEIKESVTNNGNKDTMHDELPVDNLYPGISIPLDKKGSNLLSYEDRIPDNAMFNKDIKKLESKYLDYSNNSLEETFQKLKESISLTDDESTNKDTISSLEEDNWDTDSFHSIESEEFYEEKDRREEIYSNVVCGYFSQEKHKNFIYTIYSIISTDKIGPRFLCRGVNDHGKVSFFVKTRIIIENKERNKIIFDETILRGSIPLFWYQDKNPLRKQLKFSREQNISGNAFKKHFKYLNNNFVDKKYNEIFVVDLLNDDKSDELELSNKYHELLQKYKINGIYFNLNKYANDYKVLKDTFFDLLKKETEGKNVLFRVSCLDCLDRTNVGQYLIIEFLLTKNEIQTDINIIKKMFVENGHSLSKFYAGTDSLKSELALKEKRSFGGFFDDLIINANRIFSGKFGDETKKEIINQILQKPKITGESLLLNKDNSLLTHSEYNSINIEQNLKGFVDLNITEKYVLEAIDWNVNSIKYENIMDLDFEVSIDTHFFVVALQKIKTSYKKLLFDEKQTQREKWKLFFEEKTILLNPNLVLISQNFTHDVGLIIFARNEMTKNITHIETKKFSNFYKNNITAQVSFIYKQRRFVFNSSKIKLNQKELKKSSESFIHLNNLIVKEDKIKNYQFILGDFNSEILLQKEEIKVLCNNLEYEQLAAADFLNNYLNFFFNGHLSEGYIEFLPNGDYSNNNKKELQYSSRILFGCNTFCVYYKDINDLRTGYRPINIRFMLKI